MLELMSDDSHRFFQHSLRDVLNYLSEGVEHIS